MAAAAFTPTLSCCGFNAATVTNFQNHGFPTIDKFLSISQETLDDLFRTLSRKSPAGVLYGVVSVLKVKAFKFFCTYQDVRGLVADPTIFTGNTLNWWVSEYQNMLAIVSGEKADKVAAAPPPKLKSVAEWRSFETTFLTAL